MSCMPMEDTLLDRYLTELAQNPARVNAFFMDPDGEIEAAGLSALERTALLSRDPAKIRTAMTGS
jgi:hypothetical protein